MTFEGYHPGKRCFFCAFLQNKSKKVAGWGTGKTGKEYSVKILEKYLGTLQDKDVTGRLKECRYNKVISAIQRSLHAQIPEERYKTTEPAASEHIREELFAGKNYKRSVIFLMSNGCEWALKSGHGCTMCGHLAKQRRKKKPIPAGDFIRQVKKAFAEQNFKDYPLLNIFNNGSFFNDNEIPADARRAILKKVNENPHIKMLVLETRPEFVTEEKIKEIKRLIPHKHVEIAIGLETRDDRTRILCLNKGFSLKTFEHAARIIRRHLYLRTYVFLKPPFLSEKESILQAVETIEYAFERGSTTVSLEACTVQDFTLVKYLYDSGMYTPPWLWSIVEVVRRSRRPQKDGVKARQKLIVGMFQFYPSPSQVPYNCQQCSTRIIEAIKEYNCTLSGDSFENLDCQCKEEWEKLLKQEPLSFDKKLPEVIRHLKRIIPG